MTYRPAIGVYLNGKLIDIRIYTEWTAENLIMEAVSIIAFLSDCKTFEEYHYRRYGRVLSKKDKAIHYKVIMEASDIIDRLIIADLTLKNIYCHWRVLSEEELDLIHEPDEPYTWKEFLRYEEAIHPISYKYTFMLRNDYKDACKVRHGRYAMNMYNLMRFYRIDLRKKDLRQLRRTFYNDADFRDGVSSSMSIQMLRNLN